MGRQGKQPQTKGKEEASETMLTEKEASQLSDTEFKAMVIKKLNELRELPKTTGKLQWTHCKLYEHEKGNRNYQQGPRGNEEYNFWTEDHGTRNQKQARWNRDRISELEDKVQKNTQNEHEKEKRLRENEEGLRKMKDNLKGNDTV